MILPAIVQQMKEIYPMPAQQTPAAITVSQMAEMCEVSRSRWYELVDAGVFPAPVVLLSIKRPVYDRNLIQKCLEIKETGISLGGWPVVWNRKRTKTSPTKQKATPPAKGRTADPLIEPIFDAVKALGLTTTMQAVTDAVAANYPTGIADQGQGDVIRKTFLYLQGKRT